MHQFFMRKDIVERRFFFFNQWEASYRSSLATWTPFCLINQSAEVSLEIKKILQLGKIKIIQNKWDNYPSHFYYSWMLFLISYMATTIHLNNSLTNISYPKICLLLACKGFVWQQILLWFDAILLDSSEWPLHVVILGTLWVLLFIIIIISRYFFDKLNDTNFPKI